MTLDEAKRVLIVYRPGGSDDARPEIVRALELAENDPELKQWLAAHHEFQSTVREQLQQIPVPSDLKARILAGVPKPLPIWRRQEFLAIAAAVALLLSLMAYWQMRPTERTFANFQSRMVGFALRTYEMDILSTNATTVREHLATRGAPADFSLTPALSRMPIKGGGRLLWQNHPVGMVCFDLPQNQTLYMFVIDRADVPGGNVPDKNPRIGSGKRLSTASWSDERRIYLLAAPTDSKTLAKFADQRG